MIVFSAKEIVDAIAACDNLKALRLDGNTLGIEAAKCIGKALENHPEFQVREDWETRKH